MAPFMEIEVSAGANSPMDLTRVFQTMEPPVSVVRLQALDPLGVEALCDVTGWSSSGPCPAYAVKVEDSGEGVAVLVFGGDEGIRLRPPDSGEDWDLASPRQWGEACLLLDRDTTLVRAEG